MTKEHFRKIYSLFPEPLKGLLMRFEDALIYIFYGVLTTMVNYAVHFWLRLMFATDKDWNSIREMMDAMETSAMPSAAAAAVAWAAAVAFAFYTNKYFVFEKKTKEGIWAELVGFAGGRLLSLAIEMGIMFI
ncbi:MAG: GtrA family protein, partial [Oscillospiraceae bacterium]|nr:GtrA family protein [Oscillospiraceae bacterium]